LKGWAFPRSPQIPLFAWGRAFATRSFLPEKLPMQKRSSNNGSIPNATDWNVVVYIEMKKLFSFAGKDFIPQFFLPLRDYIPIFQSAV
jgi:hypothetical protein